jgi:2-polyprenyl-3-methyl-5-hydroxy-6-metoxy-1,4-benzoquinol methylase
MDKKDLLDKTASDHKKLVEELYRRNEKITLSPEYGSFFKDNMMQMLIRLSRYKFAARMLSRDDRVLEVGSGSGLGALFMGQHCCYIKGIDTNGQELDHAKSINRRENVEFESADFFKYADNILYDAVVCLDVIEHMPEERGRLLVEKTTAHLKKTGMLILGTPSIYSYEYQGPLSRAAHVKCYDQNELKSIVNNYYGRVITFSMNDEVVHTGFPNMAWYYFLIGFIPGKR